MSKIVGIFLHQFVQIIFTINWKFDTILVVRFHPDNPPIYNNNCFLYNRIKKCCYFMLSIYYIDIAKEGYHGNNIYYKKLCNS